MKVIGLALASMFLAFVGLSAQGAGGKNDSKGFDGKWVMTTVSEQVQTETVTFKIDGTKVSGTFEAPEGNFPLTGQLVDGRLRFSVAPTPTIQITFVGGLKNDGTLAGTFNGPNGPLNWTAQRPKSF